MINIDKINNQFAFLFDVPKSFNPSVYVGNISTTSIPDDGNTFRLNPPLGGSFIEPEFGSLIKDGKGLLMRVPIGYGVMSKIDNDFTLGCLIFSYIINTMVSEAFKYKKDKLDTFKVITFNRPARKNSFLQELESKNLFLTEMEESAGYELRLYVEF